QTLTCSATSSPSGLATDHPVWTNATTGAQLALGPLYEVRVEEASPGDTLTCTVALADDSSVVAAASATVLNTPPTAPVVAIVPGRPRTGEALLCEVRDPSTDLDQQPIGYTMAWTVDGEPFEGATIEHIGDTVPADITVDGETWTCVATPHDGEDAGATAASTGLVERGCGFDPDLGRADVRLTGPPGVGREVAGVGDVDGDGYDDVLITDERVSLVEGDL